MNKQEKKVMIDTLRNDFVQSTGSFLIKYQGMTVEQMQKLRKDLKKNGGRLQVAKARLMRIASQDVQAAAELMPFFKEQVALVFADVQAPAVAKLLYDRSKELEKLVIIAAIVESKLLNKEGVQFVATLPSREVLLAQVAGLLKMPTSQLVGLLNQLIVRLVLVLQAIEQKKQSSI